jgi:hypothetical protein
MVRQLDVQLSESTTPRLTKQAGRASGSRYSGPRLPSHFPFGRPLWLCLPLNAFNKSPTIFLAILLVAS